MYYQVNDEKRLMLRVDFTLELGLGARKIM